LIYPRVSVLLPCRNGEEFLHIAIESILKQTFVDFELLFIDDGSTDDSLKIVNRFNDSRIRIFSDGLSLGLAERLNQGISHARGELIARMDADDISFPKRLEKQVQLLDNHPGIDLVGCKTIVFSTEGDILGLLPFKKEHEAICNKLWNNIPLPHPTWMGKKQWFEKNQYKIPAIYRAEDQELLLRAHLTSQYYCLEEILLGYRLGQFQPVRTLKTRLSLLKMQSDFFVSQKNYLYVSYALLLTGLKLTADLMSMILKSDRWYTKRMNKNIHPDIKKKLAHYINEYSQSSHHEA
jgi:glycosyltransferase involved in cell wall biosynthesis